MYDEIGTDVIKDRCVSSNTYKVKNNNYIKQEYVFTGWNTAIDGSGKTITEGNEINVLEFKGYNNEKIHLYAQWEEDKVIFEKLIRSFKCANKTVGDAPYLLDYTGNCIIYDEENGNWKIAFISSGILKLKSKLETDIFLVGSGSGGGAGWTGASGVGGGTTTARDVLLSKENTYDITVGKGGKGNGAGYGYLGEATTFISLDTSISLSAFGGGNGTQKTTKCEFQQSKNGDINDLSGCAPGVSKYGNGGTIIQGSKYGGIPVWGASASSNTGSGGNAGSCLYDDNGIPYFCDSGGNGGSGIVVIRNAR